MQHRFSALGADFARGLGKFPHLSGKLFMVGQRWCERAIAIFKEAGFMSVTQPRTQNEEGKILAAELFV